MGVAGGDLVPAIPQEGAGGLAGVQAGGAWQPALPGEVGAGMATLKKSSWWMTQQLGIALERPWVSVVLPPLVTLVGRESARVRPCGDPTRRGS